MQFFQSGSGIVHYRVVGDVNNKPVIALVNSLGTDFRIWDAVVASLEDDYAFILHDKRGHGLSDIQPATYTIDDHASDLDALLQHLAVPKVAVWGLSVGGLIAQAFYARDPSRVSALILSNTAHKIGARDIWDTRIRSVEKDGLASVADTTLERWFSASFRSKPSLLLSAARSMLVRQSAEGYNRTCAAIRDADMTEIAARIAVPTLCIAGDDDGATPSNLVQEFSKIVPGSEFIEISQCGHLPCLEQPDSYARIAQTFLQNCGVK